MIPAKCRWSQIVGGILWAIMAAPLSAQIEPAAPTGSHIPVDATAVDADIARKMQKEIGVCIYNREPELADKLLASSDPLFVEYDLFGFARSEFGKEFQLARCLERAMGMFTHTIQMSFSPRIIRSILAEEAYLESYDTPPSLVVEPGDVLAARFYASTPRSRQANTLMQLSDCIIANDPAQSDALLRTVPADAAERAVIQQLIPTIAACLPQGQEVALNVADVRSIVADGLWALGTHEERTAAVAN